MIFVIAVNARIADMVARGKCEKRSEYRYVHDQQQLYGVQEADVYVYTAGGRPGDYPHGPMAEARHRAKVFPETFKIHYVEEAELVP